MEGREIDLNPSYLYKERPQIFATLYNEGLEKEGDYKKREGKGEREERNCNYFTCAKASEKIKLDDAFARFILYSISCIRLSTTKRKYAWPPLFSELIVD